MKSAIGGSMLFYLVLFFTITIILLFASILSYSKAYRVKNRIINILETVDMTSISAKAEALMKIDDDLRQIGYKNTIGEFNCGATCVDPFKDVYDDPTYKYKKSFKYCVCQKSSENNHGIYYEVTTYNQFEFPIIGSVFSSKVKGETKIVDRVYE